MSSSNKVNRADHPALVPATVSRGCQRTPVHGQDPETSNGRKDSDDLKAIRHRFLSPTEWTIFAHGVGGVKDAENHMPAHTVSWWWPPRGLPPGLYREVVYLRTKSLYFFHVTSVLRWGLMIMQIVFGAILTALGSFSVQTGVPITVLGAINTAIAGLLALLHNSGLPDRYRYDMAEFEEVEDYIKEILDTGLVPVNKTIDQILAECYDLYHNAKATVTANMPVTYNTSQTLQAGRRSIPMTSLSSSSTPRLPGVKTQDVKNPGSEDAE